jgi:hypothetical protein
MNRDGRCEDDRGAITIGVVAFTLTVLIAVGLVYDGGRKLNALSIARDVASNAARAGGQQVAEEVRISGVPVLDEPRARAVAEQWVADSGHQGSVQVNGSTVTVTVAVTVQTVFLVGPMTASATEHATAVGSG